MRPDLNKVLTERPRVGSNSRNIKTRWHENGYDDRECKEDKYSMPKREKMIMHTRAEGPWDESKAFTDHLGPLIKWIKAQVGRNWDKVYSDIRKAFPNTNKQNHHLIDTHLMGYIERNVFIEKDKKGINRVYKFFRHKFSTNSDKMELWFGDIYVDPKTNILNIYKKNKVRSWKRGSRYNSAGYRIISTNSPYKYSSSSDPPSDKNIEKNEYKLEITPDISVEYIGKSWIYREVYKTHEKRINLRGEECKVEIYNENRHVLSKKELIKYGLREK